MKRTTIALPDDLDLQVREEAARRGISVAELAREAFEAQLGVRARPGDLSFIGVGEGSPKDVSTRVDEFVGKAIRRRQARRG